MWRSVWDMAHDVAMSASTRNMFERPDTEVPAMWLVVIVIGILFLCGLVVRTRARDSGLGWMSERWLAEHRAAHPL
jgi:hypothetical protein